MKTYLGDSVYCEFDGYGFKLTTENGYGATNTIYMEPFVLNELETFVKFSMERAKREEELKKK